jgi:hypothetical protein
MLFVVSLIILLLAPVVAPGTVRSVIADPFSFDNCLLM